MTHTAQVDTSAVPASDTQESSRAPISRLMIGVGFLLVVLSYMVNAMDRQVFPPLLPNIRAEYGFSLEQGGLLATNFTLGMALAGLPAGYLLDRFRRKTVLVVSIVIYSLGTMATPLATGFADMTLYRVVSGFGEGMQSAAIFAAIGAFFAHRRGLAFGVIGMGYSVGVFIAPLIGVRLMSAHGTWHSPFYLFGTAGLLIAAACLFLVKTGLTEHSAEKVVSTRTYEYMPASAYNRNTIALAVHSVVSGVAIYGFLGLYPTYLITSLHYTTDQAALAMSLLGFGGMSAVLGGWLGDRVNQRVLLIASMLAVSAISVCIYETQAGVGVQCVFAFLMGAFGLGFIYPNTNSAMQRSVRPGQIGRASGLFVTSYYGTAAFSGLLFAALVDSFGWSRAGLLQVTALPLLGVLALLFVRPTRFNNAAL
ncbi:MFS transporter [Streptomyces turgidiscabies]|uniref:Transporter, major facilitator family protein n=1 Tax=Streptomyces turgidiscabies (strain Car8) TaxID=698760 RepID=L7F996_STRT8|nr:MULTISPECIES: MFS transporter [Streptomyces]ELP67822.1 transporter, major facilitator family protein [Streptomyces turgidiscabies Car8]MDX3491066.1 MFS transporter [Streptomyces turgidiscabies]GAQ72916.1 hexuronate transporter [Streptomyces turgidiscabies]